MTAPLTPQQLPRVAAWLLARALTVAVAEADAKSGRTLLARARAVPRREGWQTQPRDGRGRWAARWHCAACAADGTRLIAEYRAAQARGVYDAEGYTPAERRAQQRRHLAVPA